MTIRLNGSTSGYTEIDAPAVAGSNTLVLPTGAGSAYQVVRNGATAGSLEFTDKIVSGTAVASTSGTSIGFTGIPSWVKRVTVMFDGVSTNGTGSLQIQIGLTTPETTGYSSTGSFQGGSNQCGAATISTGFAVSLNVGASNTISGLATLCNVSGNTWVYSGAYGDGGTFTRLGGGTKTTSGVIDRVRIIGSATGSPSDTFDAGSINILME